MGKKYQGIRKRGKNKRGEGFRYELSFTPFLGAKRQQVNIVAMNDRQAYDEKLKRMMKYKEEGLDNVQITESLDNILLEVLNNIKSDGKGKDTTEGAKRVWKRLFKEFPEATGVNINMPNDITRPIIEKYKNWFVARNSLNGWGAELRIIKSTFNRLTRLGYCSDNVCKILKEVKMPGKNVKELIHVSDTDMKRLLQYIKQDRPDYFKVAYFILITGRRRTESLLIEKKDIEMNGLRPVSINIRPETTKTRKNAPIRTISGELEKLIRGSLVNNSTHFLFPNKYGRKISENRFTEYIGNTSEKLLGVRFTPHHFRKRFITECVKKKIPITDAMEMSGLKSTDVLLRHYSFGSEEKQKEIIDEIGLGVI